MYTENTVKGRNPHNTRIFVNKDVIEQVPDYLFDSQISCGNCETNQAGRGTVLMFHYEGHELVLKHYYRGGLPGRFLKESYLYTGIENTRMWKEFHLLQRLHAMGLPVPKPVAARCEILTPFSYRGDLIMERVNNSRTLAEIISESQLSMATWTLVGEVISNFHLNDVFHADLNANNILLTKDRQVFLIDFDKCRFRKRTPPHILSGNLDRLRRSLCKLSSRKPRFNFDSAQWEALEKGYQRHKAAIFNQGIITSQLVS